MGGRHALEAWPEYFFGFEKKQGVWVSYLRTREVDIQSWARPGRICAQRAPRGWLGLRADDVKAVSIEKIVSLSPHVEKTLYQEVVECFACILGFPMFIFTHPYIWLCNTHKWLVNDPIAVVFTVSCSWVHSQQLIESFCNCFVAFFSVIFLVQGM